MTFSVLGGTNGAVYDLFGCAPMLPLNNGGWSWLGQVTNCSTYSISNQLTNCTFYVLGSPQDSDGDGLTDAYELLVSKTDPLNPDSDYDGRSDGYEFLDGTDPLSAASVVNQLLGYWQFDTNSWMGVQGQLPLVASNLVSVAGFIGNAVQVDSTNAANLKYRDMEISSLENIDLRNGTISAWVKPNRETSPIAVTVETSGEGHGRPVD